MNDITAGTLRWGRRMTDVTQELQTLIDESERQHGALVCMTRERAQELLAKLSEYRRLCPSMEDLEAGEQLDPASTIAVGLGYLHTLLSERDALQSRLGEVEQSLEQVNLARQHERERRKAAESRLDAVREVIRSEGHPFDKCRAILEIVGVEGGHSSTAERESCPTCGVSLTVPAGFVCDRTDCPMPIGRAGEERVQLAKCHHCGADAVAEVPEFPGRRTCMNCATDHGPGEEHQDTGLTEAQLRAGWRSGKSP